MFESFPQNGKIHLEEGSSHFSKCQTKRTIFLFQFSFPNWPLQGSLIRWLTRLWREPGAVDGHLILISLPFFQNWSFSSQVVKLPLLQGSHPFTWPRILYLSGLPRSWHLAGFRFQTMCFFNIYCHLPTCSSEKIVEEGSESSWGNVLYPPME